jgi:hypothetical protein
MQQRIGAAETGADVAPEPRRLIVLEDIEGTMYRVWWMAVGRRGLTLEPALPDPEVGTTALGRGNRGFLFVAEAQYCARETLGVEPPHIAWRDLLRLVHGQEG